MREIERWGAGHKWGKNTRLELIVFLFFASSNLYNGVSYKEAYIYGMPIGEALVFSQAIPLIQGLMDWSYTT